jgi:threonylcarbamoyladenosine tRNA methylthiotransferase MtaB
VAVCPCATFTIRTLGCKVNQYESQLLAERLGALGLQRADDPARGTGADADGEGEAVGGGARFGLPSSGLDLVVVNTCAVTARSEAKGRRLVRWLLRRYSGAAVVLTGCAVRLDVRPWRDLAPRAEPGRLLVVGYPDEVPRQLIEAGLVGRAGLPPGSSASGGAPHPAGISGFLGHDRAFVKVQDGCQAFCSYCVVPLVRPRVWSKPADAVVEEVRALSQAGYGEVVLAGVHLGLYGVGAGDPPPDEKGQSPSLAGLVRRLLAETDVGRLRLSSIEPQEVTDDLIDLVAGSRRLCPHFHLPLQSGDDGVLRAMNRRYTAREYLQTLARIAQRIPRPAFTTDVLLGFPGEGEAEFERTLSVVRQARFSRVHAFRYSPRPGTKAAAFPGRPPEREVLRREQELEALAEELARAYRDQFVGDAVEVLVEGERPRERAVADRPARPTGNATRRGLGGEEGGPAAGPKAPEFFAGLSERYLRVRFPGTEVSCVRSGSLVRVRVVASDDVGLVGADTGVRPVRRGEQASAGRAGNSSCLPPLFLL